MKEVLPESLRPSIVKEIDEEGHMGLSYSKITAVLTGALQEQQAKSGAKQKKGQTSHIRAGSAKTNSGEHPGCYRFAELGWCTNAFFRSVKCARACSASASELKQMATRE
mgnify:CR=1 FL=1